MKTEMELEVFGDPEFIERLNHGRTTLLWSGILMVVLGIIAVAVPTISSMVVELIVGWLLLLAGIVLFFASFAIRGTNPFLSAILSSVLMAAAGLYLVVFPESGLLVLTVIAATAIIAAGIAQLILTLKVRPQPGWVWLLISAVLSLLVGGLILAGLPESSRYVLGLFLGIDFISTGAAFVMIARAAATVRPTDISVGP